MVKLRHSEGTRQSQLLEGIKIMKALENNATVNNVKGYETQTIFNEAGEVIFSGGATLGSTMTIRELGEKAASLDHPAKLVVTLNGERSSWYAWDAKESIFVLTF